MISKKRLTHFAGFALASVTFIYFGRNFAHYWRESSHALLEPSALVAGLFAVALGAVGYFLSARSWIGICRYLGLHIEARTALNIYFVSQFGKYLPGNVAQHAGRLAMGVQRKLPGTTLAISQITEILLVMAALGSIALITGWRYIVEMHVLESVRPSFVLIGSVFLLSALVLVAFLAKRTGRSHVLTQILQRLTSRRDLDSLLSSFILIVGNAFTAALALFVIAEAIDSLHDQSFWIICAVYTVSWLAGFVTPGAPAGLGIREAIMLALLSRTMAAPEAGAVTLLFRLATTLTDLLVFLLGLSLSRGVQRNAHAKS